MVVPFTGPAAWLFGASSHHTHYLKMDNVVMD